jgi:hypothetical protein
LVALKGTLWKLNSGADPMDKKAWARRDVWITAHGHMSYFSQKDQKRLVLLDAHRLAHALVARFVGKSALKHVLEIKTIPDHDDDHSEHDRYLFAHDHAEELTKWMHMFDNVRQQSMATINLGGEWANQLNDFKMSVKNRRLQVPLSRRDSGVLFRNNLWKVKADGDRAKAEDWFQRDMWINHHGDLVYWSKKEDSPLIYYTSEDVHRAQLTRLPREEACRPWAFQFHMPAHDGMEFTPGEFSAESEEGREKWLQELVRCGATLLK